MLFGHRLRGLQKQLGTPFLSSSESRVHAEAGETLQRRMVRCPAPRGGLTVAWGTRSRSTGKQPPCLERGPQLLGSTPETTPVVIPWLATGLCRATRVPGLPGG